MASNAVSSHRIDSKIPARLDRAVLMIAGGLIHLFLGVEAAKKNLEELAEPLAAEPSDDDRSGRLDRTGSGELRPRLTGAA